MNTNKPWQPEAGGVYACLKSNRWAGTKRGKNYVFTEYGALHEYNRRHVNVLLNGYSILRQPGEFAPCATCPFCSKPLFSATEFKESPGWKSPVLLHDGRECAAQWDAKAKGYCANCNADLENGACPKCDGVARKP